MASIRPGIYQDCPFLPNLPGNSLHNAGVRSLQCAASLPNAPENSGSSADLKKALSKLLTVLKIFNTRAKILVLKFFQKNLKKGLIFSQR